jgi:hypothetical protein
LRTPPTRLQKGHFLIKTFPELLEAMRAKLAPFSNGGR